jgi:hypothetical protein
MPYGLQSTGESCRGRSTPSRRVTRVVEEMKAVLGENDRLQSTNYAGEVCNIYPGSR